MKKVTRQDRIEWMIQNKPMWEGFPQFTFDLLGSKEYSSRTMKIIEAMRAAGLYSPKTLTIDIKIMPLINAARLELRSRTT